MTLQIERAWRVTTLLVALVLAGCKRAEPAPATGEVVASAPASQAPAPVAAVARRTVAAGDVPGGSTWLPEFSLEILPASAGLTVLAAEEACSVRSMQLCTESQWKRACAADPSLGTVATWTATAQDQTTFVVRGGGACDARASVPGAQIDASRAGACCTPAVGVVTGNRHPSFLRANAQRLAKWQLAVNEKRTAALVAEMDDTLQFFLLKQVPKEQAGARFDAVFRQYPRQWLVFESCHVTVDMAAETSTHDCTGLMGRGDTVASVVQRHVRVGPAQKLASLTDARVIRPFSPL